MKQHGTAWEIGKSKQGIWSRTGLTSRLGGSLVALVPRVTNDHTVRDRWEKSTVVKLDFTKLLMLLTTAVGTLATRLLIIPCNHRPMRPIFDRVLEEL
jgi:hypothetical protein